MQVWILLLEMVKEFAKRQNKKNKIKFVQIWQK